MKIVCIGAGRLAHHLMPALQRSGCMVVQLYNRSEPPLTELAHKLHVESHTTKLEEIYPDADLYFLTIADDVVGKIASKLIKIQNEDAIIVHCSGTLPLDIIPIHHRGVFYPLQTFSEDHETDWTQTPIIITSDDAYSLSKLYTIALRISGSVYTMSDEQKAYLHLAAVFANNFTNHMLSVAEKICTTHGVHFEILKPLIESTIKKALGLGPEKSQTGPAVRGDDQTIEKHLRMLQEDHDLGEIYRLITERIRRK